MNCHGHDTRVRIVENYNIKCTAHIRLLNELIIRSDAERDITDTYYIFECVNKNDDNDVDRMTNGVGKIQSMSLVEVKALNIDSGNNIKKYKNLKIPTLDEYLICCKKNKLVPVIEFKDINVNNVKEVVDKIKGHGLEDESIIISTSYEWIKYIRQYSYKIQFQYLSDISLENINLLKEYGNYGIDVRKDRVTAENVRLAHENGAVVNVWDVKTEEEANMLIGIGVDMITSDYKLK